MLRWQWQGSLSGALWSLPLLINVKIVTCYREEQKSAVYHLKLFLLLWTKEGKGSREKLLGSDCIKMKILLNMVRFLAGFDFSRFPRAPKQCCIFLLICSPGYIQHCPLLLPHLWKVSPLTRPHIIRFLIEF